MSGEPIHISDETFEKVVMQSTLPVIVDFWAPWCGPCKMIAPTLEKLAKEMEGKLIVAKINTDDHAEWMQKFGIQGIPTLLFVAGGKVVHRQVGALPERMLRDVVTQFMDVVGQQA
ncbi:MAG: thioredoxin [Chloroflexi bacterium]|nr:thioredoxin [Chloroflexota bacterium]MDL1941821.1 thioredoxin [Chloroflexi bacterium CFX2]